MMNQVYKTPSEEMSGLWHTILKVILIASATIAFTSASYSQIDGFQARPEVSVGVVTWPSDSYKKNANWQYAADVIIYNIEATQYAVSLANESEHQKRGLRAGGLAFFRANLELKISPITGQPHAKIELRSKKKLEPDALIEIVIELSPHVGHQVLYREVNLAQGHNTKLASTTVDLAKQPSADASASTDQEQTMLTEISASTPRAIKQAKQSKRSAPLAIETIQAELKLPSKQEDIKPLPPVFAPALDLTKQKVSPAGAAVPQAQSSWIDWVLANTELLMWLVGLGAAIALAIWLIFNGLKRLRLRNTEKNKADSQRYEQHPEDAINTVFGDFMERR